MAALAAVWVLASAVGARATGNETRSAGTVGDAASSPPGIAQPAKAPCRVCEMRGGEHGLESVVARRDVDGHSYFFCSDDCATAFDADPLAFTMPHFPRPVPAAQVALLDGAATTLEDLRGEVTLVDFWATWCKPCVKSMPKIQKLQDELGGEGFRAVGFAIDEGEDAAKKVRAFTEKKGLTYAIAVDSGSAPAWEAFHVAAVPAMYLVDRAGNIVMQWHGEADFEEVEVAVREALAAPTGAE